MSQIIAMWSGPRNLSTAMMRSFGARPDCAVMDEPFFAPFLSVTGKAHPGREETLATHETDPLKVAASCARPQNEKDYVFQKHMPHHMFDGFPMDWAKSAKHFFLLREPIRVIASYVKGRAEFETEDLGFAPQKRLFEKLTDDTGARPPVIHSEDILRDPKAALRVLCAALDMPFHKSMLSWSAGPRAEDGAWAPYWYASVERSTGFGPPPTSRPELPRDLKPVLKDCERDYEALSQYALTFD
jgi:hypothetical protein